MANLPERVRVIWPHHRLYGAELQVHGWRCVDGEVQLRVRLTDGSIGCLPMAWTNVLAEEQPAEPAFLSLQALRDLRQLTETLGRRRGSHRRRSPRLEQS